MGAEETGNTSAQEPVENASDEATATEGAAETQEQAGEVTDSHGQPGINKERHDKEVAMLNAEIAKLKAEAAEAAENKAKREEYEKKAADLEAKMADTEVTHKLEMVGCKSVKAAKALLDDVDGDVAKLKSEHPYLFETAKQTGSTGFNPAGTSGSLDDKIDKAFDIKK